ncbi:MAG: phosphate ABC transporter substrate-binding protein [Endomicrobiales bacterium]|nr:phosphate ABC transporter substrate-binding protein [Endomicrobiales bacterium]
MKKTLVTAISMILMIAGTFPGPVAGGEKTIVIEGSTTVLPIAQIAAEEFMNNDPSAKITVRGGGSGVGITSLIEGTCDIADASRAIKDAELANAAGRGISPKAHVVAMDGIAVIVHPSNPIGHLSKKQVKDIFTGNISDWSKVGGQSGKIVVLSRDSASGTFEAFGELALHNQKVRADALMQASNQAVASTVGKTPGAIGYVGLGYITGSVKALKIEGVIPSKETVLSGKYAYSRPLFMYTNGKPQGTVKAFLDYVLSAEGQRLAEDQGFVGLK